MKKLLLLLTILILTVYQSMGQSERFQVFEKNTMEGTKYGLKRILNDSIIIPANYDDIPRWSHGRYVVTLDGKNGIVDTLNNTIVPLKYELVALLEDRIFLQLDGKIAMADEKANILTKFEYDDILGYSDGVVQAVKNNKIGYLNNKGKEIIPFKFDKGENCKGDFIIVYSKKWESLGYSLVTRDINGNIINATDIGTNGEVPAIFNQKGEMIYKGQIDEKIYVSPTKEIAYGDLYISGKRERRYTIVKSNGDVLEPLYYRDLKTQEHWFLIVTSNNEGWRYGVLGFNGEILLKPNFSKISSYEFDNNKLAKVTFPNGYFFYINENVECVKFDNHECPE